MTDRKCRAAGPGWHADGANLYLRVYEAGSKSWIFRWKAGGRVHERGLGSFPAVGLAAAREHAAELRALIARGEHIPKRDRYATAAADVEDVIALALEAMRPKWSGKRSFEQWNGSLQRYVVPTIGKVRVDQVSTDDVLRCLAPIWSEKHDVARRVRHRLEKVFAWAIAHRLMAEPNPAARSDSLMGRLPVPERRVGARHFRMLHPGDAPVFYQRLMASGASSALALAWQMLAACRPGEARAARWEHIQGDLWIVPDEIAKGRRVHVVPITSEMRQVLAMAELLGSDLMFPTSRGGELSDVAMQKTARRYSADLRVFVNSPGDSDKPLQPHGLRSSFRVWTQEQFAQVDDALLEKCLAHVDRNQVRASYARSPLVKQRREIMEAWAQYLSSGSASIL